MADLTVDRSSGFPIVLPVTGLTVSPFPGGFDLSWDASPALDVHDYEITRNDGETFRTSATGLRDTYLLTSLSIYQWSVSVHAGRKHSVPSTTGNFKFQY